MATEAESETPVLRCPECSRKHDGTLARIGNRKTKCRTCNRFAQAVRRAVAKSLTDLHPDDAARLRPEAERDVYARLVGSTPTTEGGAA